MIQTISSSRNTFNNVIKKLFRRPESALIVLLAFTPILRAQTLPSIEREIFERETGTEPRLIVWERPEQTDVAATVLIRFDEASIASYGNRLPELIAKLYDSAIPRTDVADQVGITFLQERDSILDRMTNPEKQPHDKNTTILASYSDRERYLEDKTAPLVTRLWSNGNYVRSHAVAIGPAVLVRYRLTSRATDLFMSRLRDRFENPIWLDEWSLRSEIGFGYPAPERTPSTNMPPSGSNLTQSALPAIDGKLLTYWRSLLARATISVAMVGNIGGEESISLANLYWSSWNREPLPEAVERRLAPSVTRLDADNLSLSLPAKNRDVLVAWLEGESDLVNRWVLVMELSQRPAIHAMKSMLDTTITPEQRRQRWVGKLQLDLDQPETAADRLAIALAEDGWRRWYAVDERLSKFDGTPEAEWVRKWSALAKEVYK